MSRPEIVLHLTLYKWIQIKKRTQRDYSLSLKLQIVQEIEQGLLTAIQVTNKYGIQARSTIRTWLK